MGTIVRTFESLTFADDFVFCNVLSENPTLCKEIAELLIGRKINRIVDISQQKSIKETVDGKGVRFDVEFTDELGKIYDIEMQRSSDDLPKRTRYYNSLVDLETLKRGKNYKELKDVYILFICTFDPFKKGLHKYTVHSNIKEDPSIEFDDGSTKIFYSTMYKEENISNGVKRFLNYVRYGIIKDDLTERIDEKVKKLLNSEERREEYMTLAEQYKWYQREGFNEGLAEGRAEGRAEGHSEERSLIRKLRSLMIKDGRKEEFDSALSSDNDDMLESLIKEYNI